ncbi:16S rRNA methyltransferase [Archaeoglobales archaeon]|nr:MAG: 16S rRNA methyltransferase [Archaeoglobales archaeon]
MLTLIFLESALELVPDEISKHPIILKDAKRRRKQPNKILLDDSKHHIAMENLRNRSKRGRPDIIHYCLLSTLDSRIREIEIYVHTINDEILWINRRTRLPRNYNRFVGLMEDLFDKGIIRVKDQVLLEMKNITIEELIISLARDKKVALLTEDGDKDEKHFKNLIKNDLVVCIGAFAHGEFSNKTVQLMKDVNADFVSLDKQPLTSLYVTNRVVCLYENARVQAY